MPKKSDPAKEPTPAADPDDAPEAADDMAPIEVPDEIVQALGGMPIPPPPIAAQRPVVTRVGTALPKQSHADTGGLLAPPHPTRRDAVKRIDQARAAISSLVSAVEAGLADAARKIAVAAEDPEACRDDGFDAVRGERLVATLTDVLRSHLD